MLNDLLEQERAEYAQSKTRRVHPPDSHAWDATQEFSRYMSLQASSFHIGGDLFAWWRAHKDEFPVLFHVVREWFCCPLTSASSERLASAGGRTVTFDRTNLRPSSVWQLTFLQKNVPVLFKFGFFAEWTAL